MKRIGLVVCLLFLLIASVGAAGKSEKQFTLQPGSSVSISSDIPAVILTQGRPGSRMSVSLQGVSDRQYQLTTQQRNHEVTVEVKRRKRLFSSQLIRFNRPELRITIPADSDLSHLMIATVSGAIELVNPIQAESITVRSVSGSLKFDRLQASDSVQIKSVSGKIAGKNIRAASVSGESISGKLEIDQITATHGAVELISVSGALAISSVEASRAIFRTISGTIETTLPQSFAGTVETSNLSGSVQTAIAEDQNSENTGRNRTYRIGSSDDLYQFSSTSGRIRITQ